MVLEGAFKGIETVSFCAVWCVMAWKLGERIVHYSVYFLSRRCNDSKDERVHRFMREDDIGPEMRRGRIYKIQL